METSPTELYDKFFEIVKTGTEQEAKDFLIDHLKEFPQQDQDSIIMAFFEDALGQQKTASEGIATFQKEGIDTLKELVAEKKDLEDKLKLSDLKDSI